MEWIHLAIEEQWTIERVNEYNVIHLSLSLLFILLGARRQTERCIVEVRWKVILFDRYFMYERNWSLFSKEINQRRRKKKAVEFMESKNGDCSAKMHVEKFISSIVSIPNTFRFRFSSRWFVINSILRNRRGRRTGRCGWWRCRFVGIRPIHWIDMSIDENRMKFFRTKRKHNLTGKQK